MAKQVKKWITINGNHVPVYEDGSLGGVYEKIKNNGSSKEDKSDGGEEERLEVYRRQLEEVQDELDNAPKSKALRDEKAIAELEKKKAELESYIKRDQEHKEGKYKNDFQNKADEYREKFLTKRSDEEIAEIKKNLDKSTAIVGTTEDDHVAYKAIQDEQERRKESMSSLDSMKEPAKFQSSVTTLSGKDDKKLEARISNMGDQRGYTATLNTDKNGAGYSSEGHKTFEEAKQALQSHLDKYNGYTDKFKNMSPAQKESARQELMSEVGLADTPIKRKETSKAKGFSAEAAAKDINAISMSHNNRGGDTENDWKKVRDTLEAAPAGTVMIQTGDRGAKYQFTKGEDGQWHGSWDSDSKTLSMGWVGQGHRPEVEFTTPDKALSKEQIKDTQTAAVNGKLNQQLGLDKNGYKIGNRSTPKVDVPEKSIKIGDKQVGVSKDPHAAERAASIAKMKADEEDHVKELKAALKQHPNDANTSYIKDRLAKAQERLKRLSKGDMSDPATDKYFKTAAEWDQEKSIKINGKKVGVNKGKTPSIRDIVGSDGEYQIGKAYTKSNMMDIAEAAGIPRSKTRKMTVAELRKMMLAMWRKG